MLIRSRLPGNPRNAHRSLDLGALLDQLLPADLVDGRQSELAGRVGVEALVRRIRLVAGHPGRAVHEE